MNTMEKAMNIVQRFNGRLSSRDIKDKIQKQCDIAASSASTYYYNCMTQLGGKKTAKKRR